MVIAIRRATRSQIPEIVSYVMASRAKTFPGQDQAILPDLARFQETYIENPDGCFLTAHGEDGQIATSAWWKWCDSGIGRLYLHTHPHLPGAIRFWERQGFAILDVQETAGWGSVVHMSRSSSSSPSASLEVDFVPNTGAPQLNGSFAANHQQIQSF
ncbi:hypothetical protein V2G26_010514 [Clonostachys chloroleuca]